MTKGPLDSVRRHRKMALVIARDGQDCWICAQPVDFTVPSEHPERPTLDHVVERRAGGNHDLGNLRLAHACCNESRDRNRRAA